MAKLSKPMTQVISSGEEFISHHGVKGQKWGVRRDRTTGVRPIAATLTKSKFGKAAETNADRYNRKQAAKHLSKAIKTKNPDIAKKHEAAAKAFLTDHGSEKVSQISKSSGKAETAGTKFAKTVLKQYGKQTVNILIAKTAQATAAAVVTAIVKKK